MTQPKQTPMTREAADRIRVHEAKNNNGKIPAGGFGARADRVVQQRQARQGGNKSR
ncbi:hypothetical protein ACQ858_15885 [Variovorax ureilyticus]|uniref:hypothetical protein n=1 Tax=Variovorax ureilyticus TaxID=1836198 RepID=UPI003D67E28E